VPGPLPLESAQPGAQGSPRSRLRGVPPISAQDLAATLVRPIFAQPDPEAAWARRRQAVRQLEPRFPQAAEILADARFPKEHWRQLCSNHPQERLNQEIRRRPDVVGIFPTGPR
jgi:putative transposase